MAYMKKITRTSVRRKGALVRVRGRLRRRFRNSEKPTFIGNHDQPSKVDTKKPTGVRHRLRLAAAD